jgi:hypothetical protein
VQAGLHVFAQAAVRGHRAGLVPGINRALLFVRAAR